MNLKNTKLAVVLFLVSLTAHAAWDIDTSRLSLPNPPRPGSPADQKDFTILFQYQSNRTQDECRAADAQSMPSLATFFGPATGLLSEDEMTAVEPFAAEVADTVAKASAPFKRRWNRDRPYDENGDIHPCVRKPGGHTSYPSMHAALGVALGDLLAQIFPEKADALHAEALRIGEFRVLGGVHHPTDVEAGRMLGSQIEAELFKNPDFQSALNSLKH